MISLLLLAGITLGKSSLVIAEEQTNSFVDVPETHRYYHSIQALSSDNIIHGFPIGTFLPDRPVNRVETLKIILESFPQELQAQGDESIFNDVDMTAWYFPYIEQAIHANIAQGYEDNTFRPGNTINLAEALKMIIEAIDSNDQIQTTTFEINPALDVPMDSWFAKYVQYGLNQGMVYLNSDQNLQPSNPVTRGQLTDLIYRLKYPNYYSGVVSYGNATYYADKFNGKGTASGEKFDQSKFTAAHRTLPFGTLLRVTNTRTNESIEVTVNDRGPYSDHALIDLSSSAFDAIGHLGSGIIPIEIEVIYKENEPQ